MIYNIKRNNLSGKDAIPNLSFWIAFPGYVKEGLLFSLKKVNAGVRYIKTKLTKGGSSYTKF